MKKSSYLIYLFPLLIGNILNAQCGPFTFYNQNDIDNFATNYPNCTEIQGNLRLSGSGINNLLGLSQLTSITGNLEFNSCSNLLNFQGLENLTHIGNDLDMKFCSLIQNFQEFSNLTSLHKIDLEYNNSLTNFEGLEQIDTINSIIASENNSLKSLKGLDNLEYIEYIFDVNNNDSLENISALQSLSFGGWSFTLANTSLSHLQGLEALTSARRVALEDNPNLADISQLSNLSDVDIFTILNCDSLVSLDGLGDLSSSYPQIKLEGNASLQDISGLNSLTSVASIWIKENDSLTNLIGLQNIDSTENLVVENNSSLNSLIALSNLSSVSGFCSIAKCPNLQNLIGLEGISMIGGNLTIRHNQGLMNLSGLDNLNSVEGTVQIYGNASLLNIEALGNLNSIEDDLRIGYIDVNGVNPSLLSLKGLENITQINGSLTIDNCPSLKNVEGLENLESIEENLYIRNGTSLKNLYGLHNLASLGGKIYISGNDSLNHIGALSNIDMMNIDFLQLSFNDTLSICNELNICNYLSNGGAHSISNNAQGCNDLNEILVSCNDQLSKIQIHPFYDINQNQLRDSNELILPNTQFLLAPSNSIFLSNTNEVLETYVDSGNFVLSYQLNLAPTWSLTTDSSTFTFFSNGSSSCDTFYFGFFPEEEITELVPFFTGPPARCGEVKTFESHVNNLGTTVTDGTLWIEIPSILDAVYFPVPPDTTTSSNIFGWHFNNLFPSYGFSIPIDIEVPIPPFVTLGDSLEFSISVEYEDNGIQTSNNFEYHTPVRCSFDPNDKLVQPSRNNNYTLFEEDLIYTIRFQNTGNDAAYDIFIRDTLDTHLDPSTFRVLSTSHPDHLLTTMKENQYLTFSFENIYLPDSTTNFDESQGYVTYLINPKEGLAEETVITNSASIYFDFNPPIVTNTTENVMVSELPTSTYQLGGNHELEIKIYPNPIHDHIFIEKESPKPLHYQVINLNGKILMEESFFDYSKKINLTNLSQGIFFIKIIDLETQSFVVDKLVKQ